MTRHQSWFEESGKVDSTSAHTLHRPRQRLTPGFMAKLLVPIGLVILAGVVIAIVAFDHKPAARRTADTVAAPAQVALAARPGPAVTPAPAVPAPAAPIPAVVTSAPTVTPATPTPAPPATATPAAGQPTIVDIRIDSQPAGATVMLVDRGKTSQLGTTPLTAGIDPTRGYDLVFTYPNRATEVQHLNPNPDKRIDVVLGNPAAGSSHHSSHRHASAAAPVAPPVARAKVAVEAPAASAHVKPQAATGDGTLMITSKPPCEIIVDGKPTGLTTPQRSLTLAAGSHTVTLVNGDENIKKTIAVGIRAGKATKVIQNMMTE